jgi:hypothetical protein
MVYWILWRLKIWLIIVGRILEELGSRWVFRALILSLQETQLETQNSLIKAYLELDLYYNFWASVCSFSRAIMLLFHWACCSFFLSFECSLLLLFFWLVSRILFMIVKESSSNILCNTLCNNILALHFESESQRSLRHRFSVSNSVKSLCLYLVLSLTFFVKSFIWLIFLDFLSWKIY